MFKQKSLLNDDKNKFIKYSAWVYGIVFHTIFIIGWGWYTIKVDYATFMQLYGYINVRSWVAVPAQINEVWLDHYTLQNRHGIDEEYISVKSEYTYSFNGIIHEATNVTSYNNEGDAAYFENIYRQLSSHKSNMQTINCYINPNNPKQSIIYLDFDWKRASIRIGIAVFLTGFLFVVVYRVVMIIINKPVKTNAA